MLYNFDEPIDRQGTHSIKWDARGRLFGRTDVLPMWVADMDFRTPDFIIEAIRERLQHELLGYTLRHDEYFDSFIDWVQQRHGWRMQRPWILYTPGVVPALNMAVLAYTQPGDRVVVQPPVYHPFFAAVEDHGRHLVRNPLREVEGRYRFDLDDLRRKIDKRTRLLLLSHPHNPGGRAWQPDELEALAEVCREFGVLIVSDEIHSDLVFAPHRHVPLASLSDAIAQQTITCMAPSKTFNLAGLATSSVIIPNVALRERFEVVLNSWHVYMGNIPGVVASVAAYRHGHQWLAELLDYVWANYRYVHEFLTQRVPTVRAMPLEATYLLWLDFRATGLSHADIEHRLVHDAGLGFNTGTMFGEQGQGFMRMNLAHPRAQVQTAMEAIARVFGT